ncbi:acyl-CoA dehydrogenase [Streptomyces sp. NRRL F-5126]|uniref:acyl-CoA dehydrogenase n=1 Tax=Streptomyces sp. NRRL F-5126 TaxID=1463857 RepID=UPI00055B4006|nr:acyl-CoA dehydrogenase [Streptomyces sp. NRRL F-5126]
MSMRTQAMTGADSPGIPSAGAEARARTLEERLGAPDDPGNPLGFAAVLAAEERGELVAEAEQLLHDQGFGAEMVPVADGGRLERADGLARVIRPVFRRDLGLGTGYGVTSLFAATPVWTAGAAEQRAALADILCGGGRASVVHHSMAHGNALWSGEVSALTTSRGFRLGGRKDVVINAARARALVVYARTDPAPGSRSHSVLLIDREAAAAGRLRTLPRQPTTGLRGCAFGGLEFADCPAPAGALVGEAGGAVPLALRTFQFHRPLCAVMVVAAAGTVLRTAVRAVARDGGGHMGERHRPLLAGVFADLLACDSLATTVLRALHLHPQSADLAAAEVKYLVPDLLREDLEELATVVGRPGRAGHARDAGEVDREMLAKLMRDLPTASLGHAGTAACQAAVIPRLPLLARTSWLRAEDPGDALFRPGLALPPLALDALAVAGRSDFLAAALAATAGRLRADGVEHGYGRALGALVAALLGELAALRERCVAVAPGDLGVLSSPRMCALADRHALLSAAAAALGVWESHRGRPGFLGDPAWLVMALLRIGRRLCLPDLPELPDGCVDRVLAEVAERYRGRRSYDLYDEPVQWADAP